MSEDAESPKGDRSIQPPLRPSMRERLRPLELLGISAAMAVFAGGVTLVVMHPWGDFAPEAAQSWLTVLIVTGAAFVLSLVVLAMLALGGYEPPKDPPSNILDQDTSH